LIRILSDALKTPVVPYN